jgi:1,2-phenylacetyl-CoA epoxidase PaaB subunit
VPVWDVLGKRTPRDEFVVVGGIKAPDVDMALVLARETHFRHKEGVAYAVRRRGENDLHVGPYDAETLGGVTDHSYRRQEAYTGVGAKHKRVGKLMAERGMVIERPRPPVGRRPTGERVDPATVPADERSIAEIPPEEIASQGTGG